MANNKLNLKIITPEKILFENKVDAIYSKSIDGEFGVLPGHISYMTSLDVGITKFVTDNNDEFVAIMGGIFQVCDDNVVILSDMAELGSEIDIPRAKAAFERAEARLKTAAMDVDTSRAELALLKALTRIKAATKRG